MDVRIVALVLWGLLMWTFLPGLLSAEDGKFHKAPTPLARQVERTKDGILDGTLAVLGVSRSAIRPGLSLGF